MPDLMSVELMEPLLRRWLSVVASRGADPDLDQLLAEDVWVERYHWSPPGLAQRIEGREAVRAWLARSPVVVKWSLESAGTLREGGWVDVYYGVRVVDFFNQGLWSLRVQDGRIVQVLHQPEQLPEEWRQGVPEGKSLE